MDVRLPRPLLSSIGGRSEAHLKHWHSKQPLKHEGDNILILLYYYYYYIIIIIIVIVIIISIIIIIILLLLLLLLLVLLLLLLLLLYYQCHTFTSTIQDHTCLLWVALDLWEVSVEPVDRRTSKNELRITWPMSIMSQPGHRYPQISTDIHRLGNL